jgi:hypothetical protein
LLFFLYFNYIKQIILCGLVASLVSTRSLSKLIHLGCSEGDLFSISKEGSTGISDD